MGGIAPALALEHYRDYLRLVARLRIGPELGGRIDASDAAQQTLLLAHARREQFRGQTEQEFRGWLRRILLNHLADQFRAAGRPGGRDAPLLEAELARSPDGLDGHPAADAPGPPELAVRAEDLLRLTAALDDLPADQATAIALHHLEELPVPEVARRMNRSVASVAGLLRRGAAMLRARLKDDSET